MIDNYKTSLSNVNVVLIMKVTPNNKRLVMNELEDEFNNILFDGTFNELFNETVMDTDKNMYINDNGRLLFINYSNNVLINDVIKYLLTEFNRRLIWISLVPTATTFINNTLELFKESTSEYISSNVLTEVLIKCSTSISNKSNEYDYNTKFISSSNCFLLSDHYSNELSLQFSFKNYLHEFESGL